MTIYIVDWGRGATGGRYALIEAKNIVDAWWIADSVSAPFRIARLAIPDEEDDHGMGRYMEIAEVSQPFSGPRISDLPVKWKDSVDLLDRAVGAIRQPATSAK